MINSKLTFACGVMAFLAGCNAQNSQPIKMSADEEALMRRLVVKAIEETPEFINGSIQGRAGNIFASTRAPITKAEITAPYHTVASLGAPAIGYCVSMTFADQGGVFNFPKAAAVALEKTSTGYNVVVRNSGKDCGNVPTTPFVEMIQAREASIKKNPDFFERTNN